MKYQRKDPADYAYSYTPKMEEAFEQEQQDKRDRTALRQEYAAKPKWIPRAHSGTPAQTPGLA